MPSLTIVIPTFNGLTHLQRCLPSVCRHAPPNTQILLVDDCSTDDTVKWVRQHFPGIEILQQQANQGFCAAANAGLNHAHGDIIELLNNDTEVCPGWAHHCLELFDDPTVGSVAPLVLMMDDPNRIDSAGMVYHLCGWASNRGYGQELSEEYLSSCEVFGASGSSAFYRRTALGKTGGFLPELGAYFEDTDLAFRLRWAGYKCLFEPRSRVLHKVSATYGTRNARVERLLSRNEELIFWMNLPWPKLLLGLVPHLGFLSVRTLRKLFSGKILPFLQGKWQAIASMKQIMNRRKERDRLARNNQFKINLGIDQDFRVLGRGVQWLRKRKCA